MRRFGKGQPEAGENAVVNGHRSPEDDVEIANTSDLLIALRNSGLTPGSPITVEQIIDEVRSGHEWGIGDHGVLDLATAQEQRLLGVTQRDLPEIARVVNGVTAFLEETEHKLRQHLAPQVVETIMRESGIVEGGMRSLPTHLVRLQTMAGAIAELAGNIHTSNLGVLKKLILALAEVRLLETELVGEKQTSAARQQVIDTFTEELLGRIDRYHHGTLEGLTMAQDGWYEALSDAERAIVSQFEEERARHLATEQRVIQENVALREALETERRNVEVARNEGRHESKEDADRQIRQIGAAAQREVEVANQRAEAAERAHRSQAESHQPTIDRLEREKQELLVQVRNLQEALSTAQEGTHRRDQSIHELESQVAKLSAELNAANSELTARTREIEALRYRLAALDWFLNPDTDGPWPINPKLLKYDDSLIALLSGLASRGFILGNVPDKIFGHTNRTINKVVQG